MQRTPEKGTTTAVIIRPRVAIQVWLCTWVPRKIGKTRFPDPKNIANMANPAAQIFNDDSLADMVLILLDDLLLKKFDEKKRRYYAPRGTITVEHPIKEKILKSVFIDVQNFIYKTFSLAY